MQRILFSSLLLLCSGWLSLALAQPVDSRVAAPNIQRIQAEADSKTQALKRQRNQWRKQLKLLSGQQNADDQLLFLLVDINRYLAALTVDDFFSPISARAYKQLEHGAWQALELAYLHQRQHFIDILQLRENTLSQLSYARKQRIFSFGPEGIRQILLEIKVIGLSLRLQWRGYYPRLLRGMQDMRVSPIPLIMAVLQLIFCVVLFQLWRRRFSAKMLRSLQEQAEQRQAGWLLTLAQLYSAVKNVVEVGLLLYFSLSIIISLLQPPLSNLIILLYLHGWLIALIAAAIRAPLQQQSEPLASNSQRSLRAICQWTLLLLWSNDVLNALYMHNAIIADRIWLILLILAAVILFKLSRLWRPWLCETLQQPLFADSQFVRRSGFAKTQQLGLFWSALALVYVPGYFAFQRLLQWSMRFETINLWLGYLFRIEVARQHAQSVSDSDLSPLPESLCQMFEPGFATTHFYDDMVQDTLAQMQTILRRGHSFTCLLHGIKGSGKSALLQHLVNHPTLTDQQLSCIYVSCNSDGFPNLIEQLATVMLTHEELGSDGDIEGSKDVIRTLKSSADIVICIDDCHHLVKPVIGGLHELERLTRLIRKSSDKISWLLSMDTAAWRFVERVRGNRMLFDIEAQMPRWREADIAKLILQRVADANMPLDVSEFALPKQLVVADKNDTEAVITQYAKILWEYAAGNPGVALTLWRQSLFYKADSEQPISSMPASVKLQLFNIADHADLDKLSVNMLLILRAIMQMEYAKRDDIANVANIAADDVIDALRFLISKGIVSVNSQNEYQIQWSSYRSVVSVLSRKHFLAI